jgi:aspartate/methionine/tyrosine aminotransferase
LSVEHNADPSSNPNNPTGAILPKSLLTAIVELARSKDIIILSDEVYRPIFHSKELVSKKIPPSMLSMGYDKTIVTGSMSKAYSLAGIRVGWIASRSSDIIKRIHQARHYTTISVSQLDCSVAAFALNPVTMNALVQRNVTLARTNLEILESFITKHNTVCSWVKPLAGTTAFVRFCSFGRPVDSVDLCKRLLNDKGVLVVPGSHSFGEEHTGYVRIGFVCETHVLTNALENLQMWMLMKEYETVKLADRQL